MKAFNWLCVGGVEVANESRVSAYLRAGLLGGSYNAYCAECEAVTDGDTYVSPATDPAPWYDPNFFGSDEFIGFLPERIDVQPVLEREMVRRAGGGGVLRPSNLRPRVITVEGHLLASSAAGMAYGTDWLAEVLAGSRCADGCSGDEVTYLPACPSPDYLPSFQAFRQLISAATVELSPTTPRGNFPEAKMSQVAFQIASEEPYIFTLAERIIDGTLTYGDSVAAATSTPEWVDGGVFVITLENTGDFDADDITVTGRISLDGSCPVSGTASSVPPSWTYTIPVMEPGDRMVIDGRRSDALYYPASCRDAVSGLPYMPFTGPFKNVDFGPCTTFCIEIAAATSTVDVTVDAHLRLR